ncbi:MAG: phosphate ABC transporter substrate-binding/OmpA family protein [Bacteroidota bacterium]
MARRLTTFSKFLITVAIVAVVFFLGRYFLNNTEMGQDLVEQSQTETGTSSDNVNTSPSSGKKDDGVVRIGVVTWGGYAGGQYFNEGFAASEKSRFYKDYGMKVEFKILDDFEASRAAWKNDEVNLLWATIDAFPTEAGALAQYDPVVVFQADWSRGGDAVVVRRGITKVSDLKGKKIAVAELTPSHSFLIWLLQAGGLTPSDVEIIPQANAIDAAQAFKSKAVDAAVVWSPDDEDCVNSVPGARILESTRSASHIIADVFIAKKAYVERNKRKMMDLYEGWMKGAAEINSDDAAKRKAAKILAEAFDGFDETMTYNAISNVRLCTHGDNLDFFAINQDYKGVTGEELYSNMTNVYTGLGYIKDKVPNWRLIRYPDMVRSNSSLTGSTHAAEGQKVFASAKKSDETKAAIATKAVSISFRTAEFQLDENAKYIIDKEFVDIAKSFANSRIRVEGNTDNVGNKASNKRLSLKRAQSVVNYLIDEHGMPRNRFIVVGNGPDKPVAPNNTEDGRSKNRRTDFELVPD